MPNHLAQEPSPYLLQHAHNPVDWYPWGNEAFEKARREDKPIFLSVGYSTCHWCHVMEHESFENDAVAEVLNAHFVPVKVDREERPDIDRVYMSFVQATTGSGGWPMSVWLTPHLQPFFGGTYFPTTARWGRPGLLEILREIARVWREERGKVTESAEALTERLQVAHRRDGAPTPEMSVAGPDALELGVQEFAQVFDRRNGGFGGAPKFPRPSELLFLLREYARSRNEDARDMALATLRAMAQGGMYDHLGGGFHRYSVDAEWRVPHFEKMLYDQAQLVLAFLEAGQVSGDPFFLIVADDTLEYVRRDMTDSGGGFYSAEDADSVPPEDIGDPQARKSEGAFYLWRWSEVQELFGKDADIVRRRFGLEPAGNAPQDPQGEFRGKNLFYIARSIDDVARLVGLTAAQVEEVLARAGRMMFDARSRRPRPHLDDKVLSGWNGLMLAAFARAARTLRVERAGALLETAQRAAHFLLTALWDESRHVLLRRYRQGHASIDGYSEDYAFVIYGLLELFQADGDLEWLAWAEQLQARQDELFWDGDEGGWYSTDGRDPSVLLRLKEEYDGAEPSTGSVSVVNLLRLSHLTGNADAGARAERVLRRYGPRLGQAARVLPMMLGSLATYHAGVQQIAVVGPRDRDDTRALHGVLARHYLPFAMVVPVEPGEPQQRLATRLPFVTAMTMKDGRATAYVCRNFVCREPVDTVEGLVQQLEHA